MIALALLGCVSGAREQPPPAVVVRDASVPDAFDRIAAATNAGLEGSRHWDEHRLPQALASFDEMLALVTAEHGAQSAAVAEVHIIRVSLLIETGQVDRALEAAEIAERLADAHVLSVDRVPEAYFAHARALHAAKWPARAGERASKAAALFTALVMQTDDEYIAERLALVRGWTASVCKCAPKR